jgi:hypothetical protein
VRPIALTRAPLAILLCLQAVLLFSALDLLPVWGDELFTLNTVAHPVREIIPIVRWDIHPPLYFVLLHNWAKLPLPWTGVAALRAFSCVWALLATLLLDLFWTRFWNSSQRWLALSLFALSPCLLLYGRMARSYSMQAALVLLALGMLRRWIEKSNSFLAACSAFAAILVLLYTHYVPGIALLAGFVLVGWRSVGAVRMSVFCCAIIAGYAPWAAILIDAVRRWGEAASFSSSYSLAGNPVLEHALKIGYGLVSLTIGESFLALSLVLTPVILLLALMGARTAGLSRKSAALLAIAAAVGYLGASRWVSYPFIPARLLWLLPFVCLSVALGISGLRRSAIKYAVLLAVLISYVSSTILYFRRENFLNMGYVAPLPEIAAMLNREAQPGDLILLDAYGTDAAPIGALLSNRTPYVFLHENRLSDARGRMRSAATVWIVRNTRDVSPGKVTTAVQSEACAGRQERDTLFEPYAAWQQAAMKIAGFRPPLTHFYQITACGPAASPPPSMP